MRVPPFSAPFSFANAHLFPPIRTPRSRQQLLGSTTADCPLRDGCGLGAGAAPRYYLEQSPPFFRCGAGFEDQTLSSIPSPFFRRQHPGGRPCAARCPLHTHLLVLPPQVSLHYLELNMMRCSPPYAQLWALDNASLAVKFTQTRLHRVHADAPGRRRPAVAHMPLASRHWLCNSSHALLDSSRPAIPSVRARSAAARPRPSRPRPGRPRSLRCPLRKRAGMHAWGPSAAQTTCRDRPGSPRQRAVPLGAPPLGAAVRLAWGLAPVLRPACHPARRPLVDHSRPKSALTLLP